MPAKTALVTGAARGIGLAATRLFLGKGYHVAMVDRDGPELEQASAELNNVMSLTRDVSVPGDVEAMVAQTLDKFGRIDCLVNNAGVADFGRIEEATFEGWREVMATNLDGVFLCSQAAFPALKDTRGTIVNVASISGLRASTLRVAYGTSKAAVIHLTKQQAAELGEFGIRVNAVAPSLTNTPLAGRLLSTPEKEQVHADKNPLKRVGKPKDVAATAAFLLSQDSSWITGQVIAVDGGYSRVKA